jgi:hypothetical protein
VIFLWGLAEILTRGSDTITGDFRLPSVTTADVDTVRLVRPADTIILTRIDSTNWLVNGHDASEEAISALFDAFGKSSVTELSAQSAASHARMGVDSARGRRIILARGDTVVDRLVVGDRGPGFTGAYVRRPEHDEVYLVRGELANLAERTLDDWRDKVIARLEPDSVQEMRIERGRATTTLRRADGGWRLGTAAADTGAVRRMLEQWRNLSAVGFATPAQEDSTDFRRPERKVTLLGRQGPLVELALDSAPFWWWVQKAQGGPIYRLESWRLDQLLPADSSLRQK